MSIAITRATLRAVRPTVALLLLCASAPLAAQAQVRVEPADVVRVGKHRCASTARAPLVVSAVGAGVSVDDPALTCVTHDDEFVCVDAESARALTCAPLDLGATRSAPSLFVADVSPRLVLDDEATPQSVSALARLATNVLIAHTSQRRDVRVTSAGDVRALVTRQGQQAVLGESDDASLDRVARSLAADRLVTSDLDVGDAHLVVELRLFEASDAKVVARSRAEGRDARALLRALGPAVDVLLSDEARAPPPPDLSRRVDDLAAIEGALLTGAVGAAALGLLGAWPIAFALAARNAGVDEIYTTPTIFLCACTSVAAVPAAAAASLAVDGALGFEPSFSRAAVVTAASAGVLSLVPAVPVATMTLVLAAILIARPDLQDEGAILAFATPALVLSLIGGVLSAPLLFFGGVALGYEAGIAFFDDTPLAVEEEDE